MKEFGKQLINWIFESSNKLMNIYRMFELMYLE